MLRSFFLSRKNMSAVAVLMKIPIAATIAIIFPCMGSGFRNLCAASYVIAPIEISLAMTVEKFDKFNRGAKPDVYFAGMMQYDGDLQIPAKYLVTPPAIDRTMSEYLIGEKLQQYAISETQKYGHVTFFWNGNKSGYKVFCWNL